MLKTKYVSIVDDKSRDNGKMYLLKEMPASRVEKWAFRALAAISKAGIFIPAEARDAGVAGIATMGFAKLAEIPWEDLEPLLDEMMTCVSYVPNPEQKQIVRYPAGDDAMEEVSTRLIIRKEIFEMHTNFSMAGNQSEDPAQAVMATMDLSNIRTPVASSGD
jgi:hypothetical protein